MTRRGRWRLFQSTHPLRGATIRNCLSERLCFISIHAPLAGCDEVLRPFVPREKDFNPRTPCGVRLLQQYFLPQKRIISIHAPLAGCDCNILPSAFTLRDFNPRTPCGVRPLSRFLMWTSLSFQSTHPLRGATVLGRAGDRLFDISIHAPLAGCDAFVWLRKNLPHEFQSTHPLRGATRFQGVCRLDGAFQSTHPLRGATTGCTARSSSGCYFNPRTPCGVRLNDDVADAQGAQISIHAPLAGCDLRAVQRRPAADDFNPRTPCGVRLHPSLG